MFAFLLVPREGCGWNWIYAANLLFRQEHRTCISSMGYYLSLILAIGASRRGR